MRRHEANAEQGMPSCSLPLDSPSSGWAMSCIRAYFQGQSQNCLKDLRKVKHFVRSISEGTASKLFSAGDPRTRADTTSWSVTMRAASDITHFLHRWHFHMGTSRGTDRNRWWHQCVPSDQACCNGFAWLSVLIKMWHDLSLHTF